MSATKRAPVTTLTLCRPRATAVTTVRHIAARFGGPFRDPFAQMLSLHTDGTPDAERCAKRLLSVALSVSRLLCGEAR